MKCIQFLMFVQNMAKDHLWDETTQKLYWVDILKGIYYKADIISSSVEKYTIGQALGSPGFKRKRRINHGSSRWIRVF